MSVKSMSSTKVSNNQSAPTYDHHDADEHPAHDHELPHAGLLAEVAVDVHGEEGAGRVEDGGQVRHEGG